jgi:type I restriction enzyme S subunit
MSHYKPYPAYKDSGVEWLGRVPEHWEAITLRRVVAAVKTGGTPTSELPSADIFDGVAWYTPGDFGNELVLESSEKRVGPTAISTGDVKVFPAGSILVVSIGATLGKVGFVNEAVSANQQINAVIPSARVDGYFLAYSLSVKTEAMWYLANAATIGIMNQEKTKDIWLALPSIGEQKSIAAHLDRETARIDMLVAKKTRFIELLREKRQALITHAVTKGLDPNVKMKDSGVEWLGEVPEHWSYGRLAYACELIVDGTHHSPESYPEGAFKYITAKNIKEHGFDFTELTYLSADQHQEIYSRCSVKVGDILYIKDGATAGVAMVNYLDEEFSLLSSVAVIRPKKKRLLSEYLAYLLNSGGFKTSVLSRLVGGAITRFTLEMIGNFSVSLPSIEEQRQVVAHLEGIVPRLDVLKGKTERSIELLKERRSALITAAVTGHIDLRELV